MDRTNRKTQWAPIDRATAWKTKEDWLECKTVLEVLDILATFYCIGPAGLRAQGIADSAGP